MIRTKYSHAQNSKFDYDLITVFSPENRSAFYCRFKPEEYIWEYKYYSRFKISQFIGFKPILKFIKSDCSNKLK